jgi:hypothetical protein
VTASRSSRTACSSRWAPPATLYEKPNNVFVAGFIGSPAMNLFPAHLTEGGIQFGDTVVGIEGRHGEQGARLRGHHRASAPKTSSWRAEDGKGLSVVVDLVEELGADGYLYGHTDVNGKRTDIVARVDGRRHPNAGETVTLAPVPGHVHVFDVESGERLTRQGDRLGITSPTQTARGNNFLRAVALFAGSVAVPDALSITASRVDPGLLTLPWSTTLADWPSSNIVYLPKGISRHLVRFANLSGRVVAIKETTEQMARREYDMLGNLDRLDVPCVQRVAVIAGRTDAAGQPLPAALVTAHLKFSLPYRALFTQVLRPDTATRLVDALAALLVRLHNVGFFLGRRVAVQHTLPT